MTAADRLDEIEARADAATDGPWECESVPIADEIDVVSKRCPITFLADIAAPRTKPNAEFIAHARADVPRLVAALRAVLDVCAGLEEAHRANPEQTYEYGLEEAAHQVRNAVEAALGEVAP